MVSVAPSFIHMPQNDCEVTASKRNFCRIADFPGIIGCADGSHVPIIVAPHNDEFT